MSCCSHTDDYKELVVEICQGEQRSYRFTIYEGDHPMDLTDWQVTMDVKNAPYSALDPMIHKVVTTTSDINKDGKITDPTNGVFMVTFSKEDSNLPPMDYYLVGELTDGFVTMNITHDGNYSAIYRVREQ